MDRVCDGLKVVRGTVNGAFGNREPWQIAAITATTVLGSMYVWDVISQDESIVKRVKKRVFKLARKIPSIRDKIAGEIKKVSDDFEKDAIKNAKTLGTINKLPFNGMTYDEIIKKVDEYLKTGNYDWANGRVSGSIYFFNQDLIKLTTEVYGKASYTNPLHPDVFPGVCKMEAEVVRMTANLFHGSSESCGTMTTGGTESIMMACKAYRDYGREENGITKPNIVMPVTAHSAFDKAAQYMGMFVKTIKVNPRTTQVDIKAMERAINSNTIMLVGSAPNFPYGTMDDIEAIAALGKKYNIPVHVDACLGGFIIVFMKRAGYQLKPFDFRIDGVTSISADTHKYGYAPKGSSVILYSEKKYLHHQYTVTTDWPGGVYGSVAVQGSRAGGTIAATWATLVSMGEDGYTEATKSIVDTAKYIENGLRKMKGIYVYGTPVTTVVAIGSKDFDIYRLSGNLAKLGWALNALQFPPGIHICVTYMQAKPGVADQFLNDVKNEVAECMKNPEVPPEGKMAIYGLAQSLPDRSLVGDFTRCFLDSIYFTPKE